MSVSPVYPEDGGAGPLLGERRLAEAVGTPCCAGRPCVPHSVLPSLLCRGLGQGSGEPEEPSCPGSGAALAGGCLSRPACV